MNNSVPPALRGDRQSNSLFYLNSMGYFMGKLTYAMNKNKIISFLCLLKCKTAKPQSVYFRKN